MASSSSGAVCLLCKEIISLDANNCACVTQKGLDTINAFSVKYNELRPESAIPIHEFDANKKQYVHESCRKTHYNTRRYEQMRKRKHGEDGEEVESICRAKLRSGKSDFSFRTDCYICGKYVDQEKARRCPNNPEYEYSNVMSLSMKETIAKRCDERRENQLDEWADAVSHRTACISDVPAEEAIYHRRCFQYFISPRNLNVDTPLKKRGRPSGSVDHNKHSAFVHVIEYLENNDDEAVTLDELYQIMESEAGSEEVYSKRTLQRQLYAHYGDRYPLHP